MRLNPVLLTTCLLCVFLSGEAGAQQYPMQISPVEKLYGLSGLWQETELNFVSNNRIPGLDTDSLYQAYVSMVIKSANDYEYYRLLQRFLATFQDANTRFAFPASYEDSLIIPPIRIREIRGRFYITNAEKSLAERIPIGSEIIRINGYEIQTYLQNEILPYLSAATSQHRMALALDALLAGWIDTQVLLTFSTSDGRTLNELVSRSRSGKIIWANPATENTSGGTGTEWIARDIALITPLVFDASTLTSFPSSAQLSRARALIIDLRYCNTSEGLGNAASLALRFTTLPYLVLPGFGTRNYPYSFFTEIDEENQWLSSYGKLGEKPYLQFESPDTLLSHKKTDTLNLPLVILTGPHTGNTAEHFIAMLMQQPGRAITIGETTSGSTGASISTELPGGARGYINARLDYYPEMDRWFEQGISPEIQVSPDIKSLLNGEDIVLKRALEYIRGL